MLNLKEELETYSRLGAETFEVDNIPQDSRFSDQDPYEAPYSRGNPNLKIIEQNSRALVAIYSDIFTFLKSKNISMKLIMKNLDQFQLAAIASAVGSNSRQAAFSRENLAPFHITEKLVDAEPANSPANQQYRNLQYEGSAKLCIQVIPSNNTYHYRSEGAFSPNRLAEPPTLAPNADVSDNCDPDFRDAFPPKRFGTVIGKKCQPIDTE